MKVQNGLSYFNKGKNFSIYSETDAAEYLKAIHKLVNIKNIF